MVKLVVFDMAGTVVDEQNLVYKTLAVAISNAGYEVSLDKVLELGAGKEKRKAIEDILAQLAPLTQPNTVDRIFLDFRKRLELAYQTKPVMPQAGAEDAFEQLKAMGIKIVLNTGYDRATATQLLARLGWKVGQHIDLMITATDVERGRPFPDMIQLAMKQLSIDNANEVVKIGDSAIDIEEGRQAGCGYIIGITTGAHSESQLKSAEPSTILNHLNELIPFLEEAQAQAQV